MTKSKQETYNDFSSKLIRTYIQLLELQPLTPLAKLTPFIGKGIYAIYYKGTFPAYKSITGKNIPIYVGRTMYKGYYRKDDSPKSKSIYSRLIQHANRIKNTTHLKIDCFGCKYVILDGSWPEACHDELIIKYKPIWNIKIRGFSHRDPGTRRRDSLPEWDTIHPRCNKAKF